MIVLDVIGKRFGKLMVLKRLNQKQSCGSYYYECICDCGNTTKALGYRLKSGRIKSCGCLTAEVVRNSSRKFPGDSGFSSFYQNYKKSAKNRGLVFSLTKEEFRNITSQSCFYCGEPPIAPHARGDLKGAAREYSVYRGNGIDRLDNLIGYISANCVPCCKNCNRMKSNKTVSDFIDHCRKILTHFKEEI